MYLMLDSLSAHRSREMREQAALERRARRVARFHKWRRRADRAARRAVEARDQI